MYSLNKRGGKKAVQQIYFKFHLLKPPIRIFTPNHMLNSKWLGFFFSLSWKNQIAKRINVKPLTETIITFTTIYIPLSSQDHYSQVAFPLRGAITVLLKKVDYYQNFKHDHNAEVCNITKVSFNFLDRQVPKKVPSVVHFLMFPLFKLLQSVGTNFLFFSHFLCGPWKFSSKLLPYRQNTG